jgi:hypothetical protein
MERWMSKYHRIPTLWHGWVENPCTKWRVKWEDHWTTVNGRCSLARRVNITKTYQELSFQSSVFTYTVCVKMGDTPKCQLWYDICKWETDDININHQPSAIVLPRQTSCHQHWIPHPSTTIARSWVSPQTTWRWSMCWSSWWLNRLARLAASRNAAMRKRENEGKNRSPGYPVGASDWHRHWTKNIFKHSKSFKYVKYLREADSCQLDFWDDQRCGSLGIFGLSRFAVHGGVSVVVSSKVFEPKTPKLPGCHQGTPGDPQKIHGIQVNWWLESDGHTW